MKITWERDRGILSWGNKSTLCWSKVRNEVNGLRELSEKPVHTENKDGSQGTVYMPRQFPKGKWHVYTIIPKADPYMAPEFIATDAYQMVDEWTEEDGHYGHKTGRQVLDYGYGLHNSTSSTTLGCGKIVSSLDRSKLTSAIQEALDKKEEVILEVI